YTRRGGLDINPLRSSASVPTPLSIFRDLRQ
ncbi:NADPH-dependent 7-cyano-7-deazaguanine reductase QueF, partial [Xanthomonas perforans]|nr:NADPH-dependent 7-cyano-7-deazaguanine reductase QueF [Xanthomonas perforans]